MKAQKLFAVALIPGLVFGAGDKNSLIFRESATQEIKPKINNFAPGDENLTPNEKNFVFNYRNEPANVGVEVAHALLESFFKVFKLFFSKGSFDCQGFENQLDDLKRQLSAAQSMVDKAEFSEKLSSQLSFLKHTFQTMADSVAELTFYSVSNESGHRQVYKIIELNVRLLALHDSYGRLDPLVKGLAGKMFRYWRNLVVWGDRIKGMLNISSGLHLVYDIYSKKAEKALRTLVRQFPEEKLKLC